MLKLTVHGLVIRLLKKLFTSVLSVTLPSTAVMYEITLHSVMLLLSHRYYDIHVLFCSLMNTTIFYNNLSAYIADTIQFIFTAAKADIIDRDCVINCHS